MVSVEHEPITGVQGQSPWSGGGEAPLKLKAFWSLVVQRSRLIYRQFVKTVCSVTVHWCQSWGGKSAWCPPTPSLGGLCPQLRRLCVHIIIKQIGVFNMDYMIGVNIGN